MSMEVGYEWKMEKRTEKGVEVNLDERGGAIRRIFVVMGRVALRLVEDERDDSLPLFHCHQCYLGVRPLPRR